MKRTLVILTILIAFACSDENAKSTCNVENPVEELEWLRTELEESNFESQSTILDAAVHQATYLGQPVFFISICCPVCDVAPPSVRSCDGTVLGTLGTDIDPDNLNNAEVIWRTNNGVCP